MEIAGKIWDEMPADVRAAIDILLDDGFQVVESTSGGMASGLVRLSGNGDVNATVSRDRGQWMFDYHLAGKNLDLDLVTAARTGQHSWTAHSGDYGNALPLQIPNGEWRLDVPAGLDWLRTTPDAVTRVEDAGRLRAKILWS